MIGDRNLTQTELDNLEEERAFKRNRFRIKRAIINRQSDRDTFIKTAAAGAGVGFLIGLGLGLTAAFTTFVPSFGLSVFAIPVFALAGAVIGGTNNLAVAGLLKKGSHLLSKLQNKKPPQQVVPPKQANVHRITKRVTLRKKQDSKGQDEDFLFLPPQKPIEKLKVKQKNLISLNDLEEYLACPITFEVIKKPVIFSDGYTFEKQEIINDLIRQKQHIAAQEKEDIENQIKGYREIGFNEEEIEKIKPDLKFRGAKLKVLTPITRTPIESEPYKNKTLNQIINKYNDYINALNNKAQNTYSFFSKKSEGEKVNKLVPTNMFPTKLLKEDFTCPITKEIMQEPVVASDGWTYERKAIENLFIHNPNAISPKTGKKFTNYALYQNKILEDLIEACRAKEFDQRPAPVRVQNFKI